MPQQALDQDAAYSVFYDQVYAPTFFEKLARDYNITPQSPEEANRMLKLAGQLRMAHDQEKQAQAAKRVSPLDLAEQQLEKQLTKLGFAQPQKTQMPASRVNQAAVDASFMPHLAHAALSMLAHNTAAA